MVAWKHRQQFAFDDFANNDHKCFIAKDHNRGIKQYGTIKDFDSLNDYIEQQHEDNRYFYEIVHEDTPLKCTSSRMCIDSELEIHKLTLNDPWVGGQERFVLMSNLFSALQKILRKKYDVDLIMNELYALDASTTARILYHVLLPFRFENDLEFKVFKRAISAARGNCHNIYDLIFNGKHEGVQWRG